MMTRVSHKVTLIVIRLLYPGLIVTNIDISMTYIMKGHFQGLPGHLFYDICKNNSFTVSHLLKDCNYDVEISDLLAKI